MGRAWFGFGVFNNTCVDIIGRKAGLALTYNELKGLMPNHLIESYGHLDNVSNMRAEDFDEIMTKVLYELGHFSDPDPMPPLVRLPMKWRKEGKGNTELHQFLINGFSEENSKQYKLIEEGKQAPTINPVPFMTRASEKFGALGLEMAYEMIMAASETMDRSFYGPAAISKWKDVVELQDLFTSQNLETQHGVFFDQRFIDYLSKNESDIGKMNWRKFEALTCEFFEREGFNVEIGPGRNDDGIDARVWPKDISTSMPPQIIIQCKRQKEKIEKVQVKSLYADLLHVKAESGLIVTTSCLSPGAKKVCDVRNYPIKEIDGNRVKEWLKQMRTPGKGDYSFEE
jgi:restriction system protein